MFSIVFYVVQLIFQCLSPERKEDGDHCRYAGDKVLTDFHGIIQSGQYINHPI